MYLIPILRENGGNMKKKIYITSLHLKHGGIEMAITLLANALVKRGYEVEILCTYKIGEPAYELNDEVEITYLTDVLPNRIEFQEALKSRNIFRIIKQGCYAVKVLYLKRVTMQRKISSISSGVIIATRNDHAVLLSKYGNKDVKKIAQLHHDHQFDKKLLKDFRDNYKAIDTFVVLTDTLKAEIKEIMEKNSHTEIVVIPNFLPDADVVQDIHEERKKQIIAVGRMHEVKGFLRLLDIWKCASVDPEIVLKLVGDGEQFNEIDEKIKDMNLEKRVVLTGALNHKQVIDEMKKSLVYVMTSYTEAFPYVLLEALSAGLPIVAYDVRVGPRAIIENGGNGYLIEDNNLKLYCRKLEELLNDEELRNKLSAISQTSVRDFSESIVLQKWIEILK